MKKLLFLLFLSSFLITSFASNKLIVKPYIEGKGLKGWTIDSIQITQKNTLVYGHFGLGKGYYAWGSMDNYIDIPATGKRYKQVDLRGDLPLNPKQVKGEGQSISFIYVFQPIPENTKVINISHKDFDGKGAAWYGIWLEPKTSIFSEKLNHIQNLEGNWYSVDGSGDWKAGFYDHKIFYNNQFWNFKLIRTTATSATFELSAESNRKMLLEVTTREGDELQIADENHTSVLSKKPSYRISDPSTFNNKISNADSVTVSGYYRVADPVFGKQAALLVEHLFSESEDIYPIKMGNDGLFSIKIPLIITSRITFSNQLGPQSPLSQVEFIAEPGDHIILTYRNEDEKGVVFGGNNQRFNNEYHAFSNAHPHITRKKEKENRLRNTPEKFGEWRNGNHEKLKSAFFDWQIQNADNAKLRTAIVHHARYGYTADMNLATVAINNEHADVTMPPLNDLDFYNNYDALYSSDYRYFLKALQKKRMDNQRIRISEVLRYVIKNAEITDEESGVLMTLIELDENAKRTNNEDELARIYKENQKVVESIFKKNQELLTNYQQERAAELSAKLALPNGLASDYLLAYNATRILNSGERTLKHDELEAFQNKCTNNDFIQLILDRNQKISAQIAIADKTPLPDDVRIHEIDENTTNITQAIIHKFKGKVIYLDFWATWCSPCIAEMPASLKRKTELNGKNVVFVYLAGDNSPEMAWKKLIREIPGDHIRLTAAQWQSICNEYNVKGIPHYLIFDKKGSLVEVNAPRPSSGENLINTIKKLL